MNNPFSTQPNRFSLPAAVLLATIAIVATMIAAAPPAAAQHSSCAVDLARPNAVPARAIDPTPRVTVASTRASDIVAAVNQIKQADGGTLYFPAGDYTIRHDDDFTGNTRTELTFNDIGDLKIIGDGPSTVLRLARDDDFVGTGLKMISVNGGNRLEVGHMTIIGQRDFLTPASSPATGEKAWIDRTPNGTAQTRHRNNEQQAMVLVRRIARSTYIHDIDVSGGAGDGVNLGRIENVVISDSSFDDLGRNGVTIGGNRPSPSKNIRIENNTFGSRIDTQQIDIELHGSTPFSNNPAHRQKNVIVRGNDFLRQAPLDTIDDDQRAMTIFEADTVEFSNNRVQNSVQQLRSHNVRIFDNTEFVGLQVLRSGSAEVFNNSFDLRPWTNYRGGIQLSEKADEIPGTIALRNNTISSQGVQHVVQAHNVRNGYIESNTFNNISGHTSMINVDANKIRSTVNLADNDAPASAVITRSKDGGRLITTNDQPACTTTTTTAPATTTTTTRAPATTTTTAAPTTTSAPTTTVAAGPTPTAPETTTTAPATTGTPQPPAKVPTCMGREATIVGTPGDDLIVGTPGPDVIVALDGADVIFGEGGRDIICGGTGNDAVDAGRGRDIVFGGGGRDRIIGKGGRDRLYGGVGVDIIHGSGGDDIVNGNAGNDRIRGNSGDDVLAGDVGDDSLRGGRGVDACNGGDGVDTIHRTCESPSRLLRSPQGG